ncbi:Cell division protein FtsH [Richelia intracellularis HH01]|uniref:Cell division protein FtsH n=1 Tax=Richelia intracellularis HH01 TaxID=1165094 RepID=M1X5R3_9NOST|nr:Cell division protein FtsH [Richelia intracellularis HH01]
MDSNRVDTVDFYEGGRTAIIEVVDPELNDRVQRVRVELPPNSPELVSKLKKKGISFDAHPVRNDGAIWGLLGNLIFPILLITGLFFYSVAQTVCLVVLVKQ